MSGFFYKQDAPAFVLALFEQFKAYKLKRLNESFNLSETIYSSWMSLPDLTTGDIDAFKNAYEAYSDVKLARFMNKTLTLQDQHSLSRVVPYDVNTSIDCDDIAHIDTREALEKAKALLPKVFAPFSQYLHNMISHVIPIEHREFGKPKKRGFSSANYLGTIFTSYKDRSPFRIEDFIVDLSHEIGHHCLILFQMKDPIFVSDPNAPVYSGVRKTHRPAIMSLHAAVALSFMAQASVSMADSGLSDFSSDYCREITRNFVAAQDYALSQLKINCTFTDVGNGIFSELMETQREHSHAIS